MAELPNAYFKVTTNRAAGKYIGTHLVHGGTAEAQITKQGNATHCSYHFDVCGYKYNIEEYNIGKHGWRVDVPASYCYAAKTSIEFIEMMMGFISAVSGVSS